MAGDNQGDRIGRASPPDRAYRARRPDRFGNFGVGAGLAIGNPAQLLPNPPLKGRRADIEGQVDMGLGAAEIGENGRSEERRVGKECRL